MKSSGKGRHYLLHTPELKEEQKLQKPLSAELPAKNRGIRCGKAQRNQTVSVKVVLKMVKVPFVNNSGRLSFL